MYGKNYLAGRTAPPVTRVVVPSRSGEHRTRQNRAEFVSKVNVVDHSSCQTGREWDKVSWAMDDYDRNSIRHIITTNKMFVIDDVR